MKKIIQCEMRIKLSSKEQCVCVEKQKYQSKTRFYFNLSYDQQVFLNIKKKLNIKQKPLNFTQKNMIKNMLLWCIMPLYVYDVWSVVHSGKLQTRKYNKDKLLFLFYFFIFLFVVWKKKNSLE